jgi:hypothetical protein
MKNVKLLKPKCEILPRRTSCQFLNINLQRYKILNCWFKKKKLNFKRIKKKKKSIYFFFFLKNSLDKIKNNFYFSIPFGIRIFYKKICLIIENDKEKKKKIKVDGFAKKKIGKIISLKSFQEKFKSFCLRKQIINTFFFIFDKNIKNFISSKITKFINKNGFPLTFFKIQKSFVYNLIKAFSFYTYNYDKDFLFSLKIECNNCPKKIKNNFSQTLSNVFDFIPINGLKKIEKIFIKTKKTSFYEIFF